MNRARAYYNEIDPAAAHILRSMIDADVIAPGDVDTRSIKDVQPDDLSGYTQCHFFAGGGLWSVAARLAGWPDNRPLWTGSCPCQPFSAAGKGLGNDDPRHLWPDFHRLIRARRPAVVMGEQVAGKAGYGWFDGVRADLAGEGYASRPVDFPACSVDAPHQRNRLYWIAVERAEGERWGEGRTEHELRSGWPTPAGTDARRALDHRICAGLEGHAGHGNGSGRPEPRGSASKADGAERHDLADCDRRDERWGHSAEGGTPRCAQGQAQGQIWQRDGILDNGVDARRLPSNPDSGGRAGRQEDAFRRPFERTASQRPLLRNGTYWSGADWIACHDGKARRAQSCIRFLVDGLPGRVDLWRVGGNAIVPQAAAEVIAAFMDVYGVPALQSMEEAA